jgi:branched-chain amino acid aminotransferase
MTNFAAGPTGDWFFFKNRFHKKSLLEKENKPYTNSIYEVFRVINKVPVFIEDHFGRFEKSLTSLGILSPISLPSLKQIIHELSEKNNIAAGNIRFELLIGNGQEDFALYQIPHSYPTEMQYSEGVNLLTYAIERENPQVKQSAVNLKVRAEIAELMKQTNIYEILLINHLNEVTEGSKSNIFFVRGNTIYSPPTKDILEGITRKRLIALLEKSTYILKEANIPFIDIAKFEGCFLTGTSPKVLPVKQINTMAFNANHESIRGLMELFDRHLEKLVVQKEITK